MQVDSESLAVASRLLELSKYFAGAMVVVIVWVWKASKDHSRISTLRDDHNSLKERVNTIDDRLDLFITADQHDLMQKQCQDHIAREQAEKIHAAVMAMKNDNAIIREDMAIMNANICKLLGKFDVDPVPSKERKRRTDGITGTVL